MGKIKVHEKALAHLSRGLYRSPASAIRELISNAWDANARIVRVDTNYPNFMRIAIQDNGDGFTREDFEQLMEGGVGNSQKRPRDLRLMKGRPVIGRLGIGMLGIAQICGAFIVSSTPRKGEGFKARVHLYDLIKERLDRDDAEVVHDTEGGLEVDVGEYDFLSDYVPSSRPGTSVVADDVHPTFIRSFKESVNHEQFKEPPLEWRQALDVVSKVHSINELGDYWRLLWELAAACPIPYLAKDALPQRVVEEEHEQLLQYDFQLIVDGITLAKPVYLKGHHGGYTVRRLGPYRQTIYGKDLRFHGYIVVQEGEQLRPDELRGVLIRIKNVAIGYYDPSLLDYRYNQGPRSRWLTSEIFVEEGLEDALNVDRDSFNRFHPHFREIQAYFHKVLQGQIFPDVYKNIRVRSTARREAKSSTRRSHLSSVISDGVDKRVRIRADDTAAEARVDVHSTSVEVTVPSTSALKVKKANQELAQALLAIFELALQQRGRDSQCETFRRLLLDLLAKW